MVGATRRYTYFDSKVQIRLKDALKTRTPHAAEHEDEENPLVKSEQIRRAHEDRSRDRRKLSRKRERHSPLPQSAEQTDLDTGRVVAAEGAYFVARLTDGREFRTRTYRGTRTENPGSTLVAIGDLIRFRVETEVTTDEKDIAVIEDVLRRSTKLARKAAGRGDTFEQVVVSNVDLLVIVATATDPPLRAGIIDRYIVAGLEGGLQIAIAINKMDLALEAEREEVLYFRDVYRELGYAVHSVSATSGVGIEELRTTIEGKTSVFAGHSGVGKSSLINALFGSEVNRTGELSKKYRRGAHTTTSSSLTPLPGSADTYIADTPGVREFANFELDSHTLKFSFVEFLRYQDQCRIANCSHLHEPGCAVRQAVEDDAIALERYSSYEKLFAEARSEETRRLYNP